MWKRFPHIAKLCSPVRYVTEAYLEVCVEITVDPERFFQLPLFFQRASYLMSFFPPTEIFAMPILGRRPPSPPIPLCLIICTFGYLKEVLQQFLFRIIEATH